MVLIAVMRNPSRMWGLRWCASRGGSDQANRSPSSAMRLSCSLIHWISFEPGRDPLRIAGDGLANPFGIAQQGGRQPAANTKPDAVADLLGVDASAVRDGRQRAAADHAQAGGERERPIVLAALGEHPAQRVELLFERRRRVGEPIHFLQQAPMQKDDVLFAPVDGFFVVEIGGIQRRSSCRVRRLDVQHFPRRGHGRGLGKDRGAGAFARRLHGKRVSHHGGLPEDGEATHRGRGRAPWGGWKVGPAASDREDGAARAGFGARRLSCAPVGQRPVE